MQLLSDLFFLVLLTPAAFASPIIARDDEEPTCGQKTVKMSEWSFTNFDYHASYIFSTPSHQNSWGYVSFNVTNPVLDYVVSCEASSSRLEDFFYGEQEYQCKTPEGGENMGTETSFTFSRTDGAVTLTQSWTCNDDPQNPVRYTAKGDAIADLDCDEMVWQNANWTMGEFYSTRDVNCGVITFPAPLKEIFGVA